MARKREARTSAGTPAVSAAERAGIDFRLHAYTHDAGGAGEELGYGLEAAELLGLEPGRVFKTLVAEAGGDLVVAIVPVDRQLDLKALARAAGAKGASLAEGAAAERATGYVLGGISPLGQKRRLATYLDASASAWESIYVSAGRRGLEIELAPGDLVELTGARQASIGR